MSSLFRFEYKLLGIFPLNFTSFLSLGLKIVVLKIASFYILSHLKGFNFLTYSRNLSLSSTSNRSHEVPGPLVSIIKLLQSCSSNEVTKGIAFIFLSMVSSLKLPPKLLKELFTLDTIHSQTISSLRLFKSHGLIFSSKLCLP